MQWRVASLVGWLSFLEWLLSTLVHLWSLIRFSSPFVPTGFRLSHWLGLSIRLRLWLSIRLWLFIGLGLRWTIRLWLRLWLWLTIRLRLVQITSIISDVLGWVLFVRTRPTLRGHVVSLLIGRSLGWITIILWLLGLVRWLFLRRLIRGWILITRLRLIIRWPPGRFILRSSSWSLVGRLLIRISGIRIICLCLAGLVGRNLSVITWVDGVDWVAGPRVNVAARIVRTAVITFSIVAGSQLVCVRLVQSLVPRVIEDSEAVRGLLRVSHQWEININGKLILKKGGM